MKKKNSIWQDGMDMDMTGFDSLLDFRNIGLSLGKKYDAEKPKAKNKFIRGRYASLKSGEAPLDQQEEYNFQRNQNLLGEDYY